MDIYREQRAKASVDNTIGYIAKALPSHVLDREVLEQHLIGPRRDHLPQSIVATGSPGEQDEPNEWAWGITTVEHAGSMVLGLLQSAPASAQSDLTDQWKQVSEKLDRVREIRDLDRDYWTTQLEDLVVRISDADDDLDIDTTVAEWGRAAYNDWLNDKRANTLLDLKSAFGEIVKQLDGAARVLRSRHADDLTATLRADLAVLAPEDSTPAGLEVRVRAVHVLQTVLLGDVVEREQSVELQIVSWNAQDHLTNRSPDAKLAGPELARLGAFLKRSWRANDWCWGRLDGASRLADLLLHPDDLHRALTLPGRNAATAIDDFVRVFGFDDEQAEVAMLIRQTTQLPPPEPEPGDANAVAAYDALMSSYQSRTKKQAHSELTEAIARRLQLAVAREELPEVKKAIEYSIEHEGSNELNGAEFVRLYEQLDGNTDPASTKRLLTAMQVGDESVGTEFGYGLLNRTISRGSAVAVNALSSDTAGLSAVSKMLSPLRTPLHTVNSVVFTATSGSPLNRLLTTLAFAISGALVGLRIAGVDVATPLVVVAEILLAGALAAALMRSGFWRQLPALLIVTTIIGLAIVGNDVDEVIYDTTPRFEGTELPSGVTIELGDIGQITLTRTSGDEHLDGELLLPGGTIHIESDGAVVREVDEQRATASWKRWFFTEGAIMRWVVIGAAFLAIIWLLRHAKLMSETARHECEAADSKLRSARRASETAKRECETADSKFRSAKRASEMAKRERFRADSKLRHAKRTSQVAKLECLAADLKMAKRECEGADLKLRDAKRESEAAGLKLRHAKRTSATVKRECEAEDSKLPQLGLVAAAVLLAGGSVYLALTDGFRSASQWALTGEPEGPWPKQAISRAADTLGGYRVEIVLLVMMVVAVMLGQAYDLVLRRWVRRIRLWLRTRVTRRTS
jgi:hypothetical protein